MGANWKAAEAQQFPWEIFSFAKGESARFDGVDFGLAEKEWNIPPAQVRLRVAHPLPAKLIKTRLVERSLRPISPRELCPDLLIAIKDFQTTDASTLHQLSRMFSLFFVRRAISRPRGWDAIFAELSPTDLIEEPPGRRSGTAPRPRGLCWRVRLACFLGRSLRKAYQCVMRPVRLRRPRPQTHARKSAPP